MGSRKEELLAEHLSEATCLVDAYLETFLTAELGGRGLHFRTYVILLLLRYKFL